MKPTHLLDTSVYCQPLKPSPLVSVENRWRTLGDERLAISVICEAEILFGLELKQSAKLSNRFNHLLKDRLASLPVDSEVAQEFAKLKGWAKRKGHGCSDFDLMIAATARAHGLTLATLNVRHFQGLDGVAVEDWSVA